jgi:hypothetical protein
MRAVAVPGRLIWGGIGLATALALAVPGTRLIIRPDLTQHQEPQSTVTETMTVTKPVASVTVQSYGGTIHVMAGRAGRVQVIAHISYDRQAGASPAVTASVSAGHLTVADPDCADTDCSVDFSVTVPPDVTATLASGGGPATVSGIAGAEVVSEGGPVSASDIHGPLTVNSGSGPVQVNGLVGPLHADSEGGDVTARDVDAKTATISTGDGPAWIAFAAAPDTVTVSTDGGDATMIVPGGPYALTAETDGGAEEFGIATDPAARRSITIATGGGQLSIRPGPAGASRG